jgi:hypothetical protein
MDFCRQHPIIADSSSGIGRATVRLLTWHRAHVSIIARRHLVAATEMYLRFPPSAESNRPQS